MNYWQNLGGKDPKKMTRFILKNAFDDEVLSKFSVYGTHTKRSFIKFVMINATLLRTIRRRFPLGYSDTEHKGFLGEYLKHATTRLKRAVGYGNKSHNV